MDLLLGVLGHFHHQGDVLLHRQMGEQAPGLDHISHQVGQLVDLNLGHRSPVDLQGSLLNGQELVDALEQRGFPTAAGTNEHKKLTILNG